MLDDASKAFDLETSSSTATETIQEASRVNEEQMDDFFVNDTGESLSSCPHQST